MNPPKILWEVYSREYLRITSHICMHYRSASPKCLDAGDAHVVFHKRNNATLEVAVSGGIYNRKSKQKIKISG